MEPRPPTPVLCILRPESLDDLQEKFSFVTLPSWQNFVGTFSRVDVKDVTSGAFHT